MNKLTRHNIYKRALVLYKQVLRDDKDNGLAYVILIAMSDLTTYIGSVNMYHFVEYLRYNESRNSNANISILEKCIEETKS